MERRKAFATAGAVSVTALAAVVAMGANMGLFGLTKQDDGPGRFRLVDNAQHSPAPVRTEVVDVPVPVAEPAPAAHPSGPEVARRSSTAGSSAAPAPTPSVTATPTRPVHEPEDGAEPGAGDDD